MIPIDLGLFKMLVPIIVAVGALILFLWSRVEHPLRTLQLGSSSDKAFQKLREVIREKGFSKLEEDESSGRIRIKGTLKIVDFILYRCWSKEIIFQVTGDKSSSKLTVTCKPSPFRITASLRNPNYLSQERLDDLLKEITV